MKSEKTNHLFQELMFLMTGCVSELKNLEITARHIQAARNEIELLENIVHIYNEVEKGVDVIDNCICDNCSSTVLKGWIYCSYCGVKLLWEDDTI